MATACTDIANTGFPFDRLILIAVCCLAAGIMLLLFARARRQHQAIGFLVVLAVAVAASLIAGAPSATATPCQFGSTAHLGLSIVQTSSNVGLRPGVAPAGITGRITNRGDQPVHIDTIEVSIIAIVRSPDASSGKCTPSDYTLAAPSMQVDRTLSQGQAADFSGASIGFRSTAKNQDACQGATVRLRFVSFGHPTRVDLSPRGGP